MQTSVYIIKPEAMASRSKIRTMIERAGPVISEAKILVLPEWTLKKLYADLSEDLWNATCLAFVSLVEIGLVTGENAVADLLNIAGTETAPAECDPSSIRFRFGRKDPFVIGKMKYYANAIHRPKNKREAKRDVRTFHQL